MNIGYYKLIKRSINGSLANHKHVLPGNYFFLFINPLLNKYIPLLLKYSFDKKYLNITIVITF